MFLSQLHWNSLTRAKWKFTGSEVLKEHTAFLFDDTWWTRHIWLQTVDVWVFRHFCSPHFISEGCLMALVQFMESNYTEWIRIIPQHRVWQWKDQRINGKSWQVGQESKDKAEALVELKKKPPESHTMSALMFFSQISRAWKAEDGEGRTSMTVTMMCISSALVISWIVVNNCCMSFLATLQYSLNGKKVELFLVPSDILLSHVIIVAFNWRYAEKPPDGVAPPKAYTCHAHQQKGACKIISWSLILGWFWSLNHFQSTLDSWQLQQLHPWNFTLTPNKNSVLKGFT